MVNLPNGPVKFWSIAVQLYYCEEPGLGPEPTDNAANGHTIYPAATPGGTATPLAGTLGSHLVEGSIIYIQGNAPLVPYCRGRLQRLTASLYTILLQKEENNFKLATKLQLDSIIITPSALFKESNASKIDNLVVCNIFNFKRFNPITYKAIWLFKFYIVCKVKNKSTKLYKKLCLIVQGYNNIGKKDILT